VVVGGGVAGLVAATVAARNGSSVGLLEKSSDVGGRAMTRENGGFLFNLGPHALYRRGQLRQTLNMLGVEVRGQLPPTTGGYAVYRGQRHTLPAGLTTLLTTGLLTLREKFELARFLSRLAKIDVAAAQQQTLTSWLQANVDHERSRQLIAMLVRVTSFSNDPDHQSAGAALEQLQLGVAGNVLYLDGGWQTIVDGLRRAATDAGVRITQSAHAAALERSTDRTVTGVRLSDGSVIPAGAVIVAATPADVDALAGTQLRRQLPPPVRVATLDVALRQLPRPKALVAFGVDEPYYFSVHSASARLAPNGGAVIHVTKYLPPRETAGREVERELEAYMDMMQPRWRDVLEFKQYLPNLAVTNCEITAAMGGTKGRPASQLDAFDNVFIAGDWVGPRGQLSDAAAASAAEAARLAATNAAAAAA
jgi:phytoene dehydrogenase-like protein